jgi:lysophospholipase L1-like esterase
VVLLARQVVLSIFAGSRRSTLDPRHGPAGSFAPGLYCLDDYGSAAGRGSFDNLADFVFLFCRHTNRFNRQTLWKRLPQSKAGTPDQHVLDDPADGGPNQQKELRAAILAVPAGMSPRVKNFLKNISLSLASLLVFVGLLELVLRFMGYGNVEIYAADPVLYWKLKPNQNCFTKIDHKPVRINSHGTRGKEFELDKPADTLRILSLGDSRTFGWGMAESESFSGLLEQLMQEKRKVEVINAGVNAWSFPQMLVYFRDTGIRYKPDIVIVGEANLWTQFSENNSPEFIKKFMARVRLKNLLRRFALYHYVVEVQLKDFYERYRTKFIPVDPKQDTLFKDQQHKDPDAVFRQAIESICQVALTNGIKPVLLYMPTVTDLEHIDQVGVYKAKKGISERLKVPLVDVTADIAPKGKALYLEGDPVHLNVEGNEIVARKLLEEMMSQVAP